MKKFFSPTTMGFYDDGIHTTMPPDVIELDADDYQDMIDRQSRGGSIVVDGGAVSVRDATAEQRRAALVSRVEAHASTLRAAVSGTRDPSKLEMYSRKLEVAKGADLSSLADEATARSMTVADLGALIIQRAQEWMAAGLQIDAAAAQHKATIAALNDDALDAYDVTTGWPS